MGRMTEQGLLDEAAMCEARAAGREVPKAVIDRLIARASGGGTPANIKAVQDRASKAASLAADAYKTVEKFSDFLEKEDGPMVTVSPTDRGKLHKMSSDLRTIESVAKQVASGYPKRRA